MILDNLQELEELSIKRGIPIIGREKGAWLVQMVKETDAKRILEIGTANGYSGCILGSEGAELTTIEIDGLIAKEAQRNFEKFKINARIVVGDGVNITQQMVQDENNHGSFDLIFIDFAKNKYVEVLHNCIILAKEHGLIIADNITMAGCLDYRKTVFAHPQLKTEFIDIKDGLSCSEKVG